MKATHKGDISELKAATAITERGFAVSIPFSDDARYDLVADIHGDMIRVQVKTGRYDPDDGSVTVQFRTKHKRKGEYHESYYTSEEVDAYAVYSPQTGEVYWIWFEDANKRGMTLRVDEDRRVTSYTNLAKEYRLNKQLRTNSHR